MFFVEAEVFEILAEEGFSMLRIVGSTRGVGCLSSSSFGKSERGVA